MAGKLEGVFIPAVTPFIREEPAYDKLGSNIEKWNKTKVTGYMVLGSNGEFRSLTDHESLKVVETAVKYKSPDKTLIVGAGKESTRLTLDFIKQLRGMAVDYVSFLIPNYFGKKMGDAEMARYFIDIADCSPLPVLIYCAPSFSNGVTMSAKTVKALSQHPRIKGIKDTSADMMTDYCLSVKDQADFAILAGSLNNFLVGLFQGAKGGVLSMANYLPEHCCALYDLFKAGEYGKAWEKHLQLVRINRQTAGRYGVPGVKACMDIMGYFGGEPRLPLLPLTEKSRNEIEAVISREGNIER
jgi:4-hydroxy-2-oxoglutarate aldolase